MRTEKQPGTVSFEDVAHALRALGGIVRDPNRTDLIGEFIGSLTGPSALQLFDAVYADPVGRVILDEGRDLRAALGDRAALAAMPEGSLGRAYLEWTAHRDFSAEGIAAAISNRVDRQLDGPFPTMAARIVDMHDLWHVLNDWDSDIHGELHLLGYSYAQLGGYAWLALGLLALPLLASGGRFEGVGYLRNAIDRGRRAKLLVAVDWEGMLPLPLDDVRRHLQVDEPVPYRKLTFAEAERIGADSVVVRFVQSILPASGATAKTR